MIEFKEENHYYAIYFVEPPTPAHCWKYGVPHMDLLGVIYRESDGTVRMQYRFAYYDAPEQPREDARTSWYNASSSDESKVAEILSAAKEVCELAALRNGSSFDWLDINGDMHEALRQMKSRPWCRLRVGVGEHEPLKPGEQN